MDLKFGVGCPPGSRTWGIRQCRGAEPERRHKKKGDLSKRTGDHKAEICVRLRGKLMHWGRKNLKKQPCLGVGRGSDLSRNRKHVSCPREPNKNGKRRIDEKETGSEE